MYTLAQDLALLLTDDAKGTPLVPGQTLAVGMAGAVLADLLLADLVTLPPGGTALRPGRLEVAPRTADLEAPRAALLADPVLADYLHRLRQDKPRKPASVVSVWSRTVRPAVLQQLGQAGILRRTEDKVLGVIPRTTWPAVSVEHEKEVRRDVRRVVVAGRRPDDRQCALVALLRATSGLVKVVPEAKGREVRARVRQIAAGTLTTGDHGPGVAAAHAAVVAVLSSMAASAS